MGITKNIKKKLTKEQAKHIEKKWYPIQYFHKGRPYGIENIVIHHTAGILSADRCGDVLRNRGVSAHYGIGRDGEVDQYVSEGNRAWACGDGVNKNSRGNDRGISIETSNSVYGGDWHVADETFEVLVNLVYDIAHRNHLLPLVVGKNLLGHRDLDKTVCPGPYLYGKLEELARRVNNMAGEQEKPIVVPDIKPAVDGLPARGYIRRGDNLAIVGRISTFMYKNFPAYTDRKALGKFYGPYIERSIKEFQRRLKNSGEYNDNIDGYVGPITLKLLKKYGFKG